MKCPWCVAEGERSTLTPEVCAVTCMGWTPYYDEDGSYHTHDPNGGGSVFLCSRGHRWAAAYSPCGSCDWGKREARLIEVRCAGSGVPTDAASPQPCPECGDEYHVIGLVSLDASKQWAPATYTMSHHFIRPAAGPDLRT